MILAYSVYNFLNLDMDLLFLSNLIGQGIKTSQFLKCGPQITSSALPLRIHRNANFCL